MSTSEVEFVEKARRHIFNCRLTEFPVVFELYIRAFGLSVDQEKEAAEIYALIRASADAKTAYVLFCHHLDGLT